MVVNLLFSLLLSKIIWPVEVVDPHYIFFSRLPSKKFPRSARTVHRGKKIFLRPSSGTGRVVPRTCRSQKLEELIITLGGMFYLKKKTKRTNKPLSCILSLSLCYRPKILFCARMINFKTSQENIIQPTQPFSLTWPLLQMKTSQERLNRVYWSAGDRWLPCSMLIPGLQVFLCLLTPLSRLLHTWLSHPAHWTSTLKMRSIEAKWEFTHPTVVGKTLQSLTFWRVTIAEEWTPVPPVSQVFVVCICR